MGALEEIRGLGSEGVAVPEHDCGMGVKEDLTIRTVTVSVPPGLPLIPPVAAASYSSRKALIGAIRDARAAGTRLARNVIATSADATAARVHGSVALTP